MLYVFYILVLLLFIYSILIIYYTIAWMQVPEYDAGNKTGWKADTMISVVIPARNEEKIIIACLQSLMKQYYPNNLFEIIVVNDHSTDKTEDIVRSCESKNVKLINLSDHVSGIINSYKKKAIETGIEFASGSLIVTTDADCIVPPEWLNTIASFHENKKAKFIAAPVKIEPAGSFLSVFQSLDFMVLQGITGASVHKKFHTMCNGANLAYTKEVFKEADGFKGIDHIASGDDMLLMHKIFRKYPDNVLYLKSKNAIVSTQPAKNWREFFYQRIRWASKADKYNDKRIYGVLLLVYLLNLGLVILFFSGIFEIKWLWYTLLLIVIKTLVELPFVISVGGFFSLQKLLAWFPIFQLPHIAYTVIAGWFGQFGNYEWKGRKVK